MYTKLWILLTGFITYGLSVSYAHAVILYENGFETGTLGGEWTTSSSTPQGRVGVSNVLGTPVHNGSFHLAMDRDTAVGNNLNEAILTLDLSNQIGVNLAFWHKDVNDEDLALPASFSGSVNGDGVSFSVDGTNWYTLVSLNDANSPNLVYTNFNFDLSAAALTAGVALGPNTSIKFQQYDNFPFNTDGRTFDDILVTAVPEPATFALLGLAWAIITIYGRRKIEA